MTKKQRFDPARMDVMIAVLIALVSLTTVLELEKNGEKESAARLRSQSEIAQARSEKGVSLSPLF